MLFAVLAPLVSVVVLFAVTAEPEPDPATPAARRTSAPTPVPKKLPIRFNVVAGATPDEFRVEVIDDAEGKLIGVLMVAVRTAFDAWEFDREVLKRIEAIEHATGMATALVTRSSVEAEYAGKGIGTKMYEVAAAEAAKRGWLLGMHEIHDKAVTSYDARRVWVKLAKKLPSFEIEVPDDDGQYITATIVDGRSL